MRLPEFEYHAPSTLREVAALKAELGQTSLILAGGTDLLVRMKQRLVSPGAVISLRNVKELSAIEEDANTITIHAGATLTRVANHPSVLKHFPLLADSIKAIGATSIQHYRGTLIGNLCLAPRCNYYNQSLFWRIGKGACHRTGGKECHALQGSEACQAVCSGDAVPALVALSAEVDMIGKSGNRRVSVKDFFTGKGESHLDLGPDEVVTSIRIPIPWAPISSNYTRIAYRSAVDFPLVNAACVAIMENGVIAGFKLCLSSIGPGPVLLSDFEKKVKGLSPDPDMVIQAGEVGARLAEGIMVENMAAPKEYRLKLVSTAAQRAVKDSLGL